MRLGVVFVSLGLIFGGFLELSNLDFDLFVVLVEGSVVGLFLLDVVL